VSVAIVIGIVTGVVSGVFAYLWKGSAYLGVVLFITMIITMAIAGIMGAAVPLTLKALKQDPAVGSGVFVTTITDLFGFFAFLQIGTMLLDRLL
jgi:magnesium transporter